MPNLRLVPAATASYAKTIVAPPAPTKVPLDRQLTSDEVAQARNAAFALGYRGGNSGFRISGSHVTMSDKIAPGQAMLLLADIEGRWQHLGTVNGSEIAPNLKQKYAGSWPVGFPSEVLAGVAALTQSLGDNSWFDGGEAGTSCTRFPLTGVVVDPNGVVVGAHYGHIYQGDKASPAQPAPPTALDAFEGDDHSG